MKVLKRIALSLVLIIALAVTSLLLISVFYGKEVKKKVVEQINQQLTAKVDVDEIDFSVVKHFPFAAVEFKKVKIHNPKTFESAGLLLVTDEILLQFNMLDILNENYIIKKITVNKGVCNIQVDSKGNNNLNIIRKTNDGGSESFKLSGVLINEMIINYSDKPATIVVSAMADRLYFSGNFYEKNYSLKVNVEGTLKELTHKAKTFLKNKLINSDFELDVAPGIYNIKSGNLTLNEILLNVTGKLTKLNDTLVPDIKLAGENFGIAEVRSFLSDKINERLKEYESDGSFYFNAHITEQLFTNQMSVEADFGVTKGTLTYNPTGTSLEKLRLKGSYTSIKGESISLSLKDIYGELGKGNIRANIEITDFKNPFLNVTASGTMNASEVKEFIRIEQLEELKGNLKMNAAFKGRIEDLNSFSYNDFRQASATGIIELTDGMVKIKDNPFPLTEINARLNLKGNDLNIDELEGKYGKSDFIINGYCKNFLAYIFIEDQGLMVDASVISDKLDLNEILSDKSNNSKNSYQIKFSEHHRFNINCKIGEFVFRKFGGRDIKGTFTYAEKVLRAEDVSMKTLEGSLNLSGNVIHNDKGMFMLLCESKLDKINMNRLFYASEDFGQSVLKSENVSGMVSADILLKGEWDSSLACNLNSLVIQSHILIEKGELRNFEPLFQLSKFVELDDLKHIKFSKLENNIEIKEKIITVPQMEIASNAMNLSFWGTHTFDNVVDYHFKVLLNELLSEKAKKSKKENDEFGIVEDDGLGRTTLFIGMKGSANNPKIYYDSKEVKQNLKQNVASEKQTIKSILKQELGLFKKDQNVKIPEKKKEKEIGVQWEENEQTINEKKETPKKQEKVNKLPKKSVRDEEELSGENSDDFN